MSTFFNAPSQTMEGGGLSSREGKRNRKAQALSALLSASALGLFLEGCGGGEDTRVPGDGSASNPYLATAGTDSFIGYPGSGRDWVSYENSDAGVTILLNDGSSDCHCFRRLGYWRFA